MFCTLYENKRSNWRIIYWVDENHTNHSVCLKPAAAKRKKEKNEICILSNVNLNVSHQCDRLFLHILWCYGLSEPHNRSLLTGGFLGSLCQGNQSQARITSGSSQSQHSCYDAHCIDGGRDKLQPACITEWVQMQDLSSISKIRTLTPHRMQGLCNLVD